MLVAPLGKGLGAFIWRDNNKSDHRPVLFYVNLSRKISISGAADYTMDAILPLQSVALIVNFELKEVHSGQMSFLQHDHNSS